MSEEIKNYILNEIMDNVMEIKKELNLGDFDVRDVTK